MKHWKSMKHQNNTRYWRREPREADPISIIEVR